MRNALAQLPDLINLVFNALDLIVVRLTLLSLAVIGAWTLLHRH
jgi:hypothetical protein